MTVAMRPRARATSWSGSAYRPATSRSTAAEADTTTGTASEERGFWASLFLPEEDRQVYAEGVQRGGYLLTVEVDDELEAAALDVLENSGAIDIDDRGRDLAPGRLDGWPIGQRC